MDCLYLGKEVKSEKCHKFVYDIFKWFSLVQHNALTISDKMRYYKRVQIRKHENHVFSNAGLAQLAEQRIRNA